MECFVARCGYTGEDGFEIFVPEENAVKLWQLLCQQPEVSFHLSPPPSFSLSCLQPA